MFVHRLDLQEFTSIQPAIDAGIGGLMDITRAILPHFRANHGGGVINVSSGAGFWAQPTTSMYSASKFALEGFTEALSYELASQNIFVKSVVPHGGITSTAFFTRFGASRRVAGESGLSSYNEFSAHIAECVRKMVAGAGASSADVAETILTAATDGTDQLRYFIGNDARGFLQARYASRSDAEYMAHMRSYFK
ncbi:short-chain dehydrogenase reductase SDR [Mycena olivaceomarginata]|nr:short-chain dehydrogenase reductase SDR [Mycena olivaceomarginata]